MPVMACTSPSIHPLRPAFMTLLLIVAVAGSARAQDMTCRKGDVSHRLQLLTVDDERGLPCEVILWPAPTEPRRLWRAEFERGFCAAKLRRKIERLTDDGWQCRPTDSRRSKHRPAGRQPIM